MMKSIPSFLTILISSQLVIIHISTSTELDRSTINSFRSHWLSDSHGNRNEALKRWLEQKRMGGHSLDSSSSSPFDILHAHKFKGR